MGDGWSTQEGAPTVGTKGAVTLIEGSAFLVCGPGGEVGGQPAEGFFFRDVRFLSRWGLKVNGHTPEPLAHGTPEPYAATFVARTPPRQDGGDSYLMVLRQRYIGRGMREDVTIRNYGDEPVPCSVEISYGADFADLDGIKDVRVGSVLRPHAAGEAGHVDGGLVFEHRQGTHRPSLRIGLSRPAELDGGTARFELTIPAKGEWTLCQQFSCAIDNDEIEPRWLCGEPISAAKPAERMAAWRRRVPVVDTDHDGLRSLVVNSSLDLGALRLFDPDFPERTVVAAGAPWSMTLFGRDSILTAWMALIVDPELALGTLQTLARFQGRDVNPVSEEEPGRILHQMRAGEGRSLSLGGGPISYGSADVTPLFVMLLGELRRWGLAPGAVDELLPHADRAIEWITHFGDRDGDGYVEYQRSSEHGFRDQGWKDSPAAVRFADGRIAEAPIALAEVQGYVYGAYLARAFFAAEAGDTARSAELRARAADLKAAFNRDFWLEDRGWLAMGLDADKRPIDALTSNMGHCLWTGILDADKADLVARRLLSPEMFTGWGVRTLGSSMGGYNPLSYHRGSVWPHDTATVAAGLMRYGHVRAAQRLILGMLDAGTASGGRLPELFGGLDRMELPMVVSYPTSCVPQAWASASPLLMLRTLLRLDPWVPRGKVWLQPALPSRIQRLHVGGIPLAGSRVSVMVEGGDMSVEGLPPDLELVAAPRHPLTGS